MKLRTLASLPIALAVVLAIGIAVIGTVKQATADSGGRPFSTTLTGAAEVPGPGDPDGSGTVSMRLNHGQGEICYSLAVSGIDPATAAHIHIGTTDEPGPVVVGLAPPTSGESSGCIAVPRELIKNITQHPERYYVNVHNAAFPAGAVRGQLGE
jgi:hypothetical protein